MSNFLRNYSVAFGTICQSKTGERFSGFLCNYSDIKVSIASHSVSERDVGRSASFALSSVCTRSKFLRNYSAHKLMGVLNWTLTRIGRVFESEESALLLFFFKRDN